jgi:hypothetical protein
VSSEGIKGVRFGTDTGAQTFESKGDEGFSYTLIKNNNSKSFKEGASVVKNLSTAYGVIEAGKQMTAQKASDNALAATQAKEATIQNGQNVAPVVVNTAEGFTVDRAIRQ